MFYAPKPPKQANAGKNPSFTKKGPGRYHQQGKPEPKQ